MRAKVLHDALEEKPIETILRGPKQTVGRSRGGYQIGRERPVQGLLKDLSKTTDPRSVQALRHEYRQLRLVGIGRQSRDTFCANRHPPVALLSEEFDRLHPSQ